LTSLNIKGGALPLVRYNIWHLDFGGGPVWVPGLKSKRMGYFNVELEDTTLLRKKIEKYLVGLGYFWF